MATGPLASMSGLVTSIGKQMRTREAIFVTASDMAHYVGKCDKTSGDNDTEDAIKLTARL